MIHVTVARQFSFVPATDSTSPAESDYEDDASRTLQECARHDSRHSPARSLCETLRWHPQCAPPGEVHARACDERAESRRISASTPRCDSTLLRCVRCSRRNEPNSDAQRNYWEKPPARIGKTRWNPGPPSDRVPPQGLHRQSLAESKDLGQEGSPSKRRKWLYGRRRTCRGSACLRGTPQSGHGSPYAAVPHRLSCWKAIALSLMPLAQRERLAVARKHRIVRDRQQLRTDPVARLAERSAPLRSKRTKQCSLTPDHKRPELPWRKSSLVREDCQCRAEAGAAARESRAAPSRQLQVLRGPHVAPGPALPILPTSRPARLPVAP